MPWEWIIAAAAVALATTIWICIEWQRRTLLRLRRYDEQMERFARAAHKLLKYEDLPPEIESFIYTVTEATESPHLAGRVLLRLVSEPPEGFQAEQEHLAKLQDFLERHHKAAKQFGKVVRHGLMALIERSGPFHGWLARRILDHLAKKHMLRNDMVAINMTSSFPVNKNKLAHATC